MQVKYIKFIVFVAEIEKVSMTVQMTAQNGIIIFKIMKLYNTIHIFFENFEK